MDILDKIFDLLKRIGIPIMIVVLVVAAVILYRNYLEMKLLNLNILQAKRDLGIKEENSV